MSSSTARICGEQVEPRDLRHHQIEHDEVKHLVADPLDRERRLGQRRDIETFGAEEILEVLQDVGIVIDDEHRQLRRCLHRRDHG